LRNLLRNGISLDWRYCRNDPAMPGGGEAPP